MAETIKDGTGGGHLAKVSDHNMLSVEAMQVTEAVHHCHAHEELYAWTVLYNATAGDFALAVRNENPDKVLCVEGMILSNDAATVWSMGFGTWATVGGAAEIVGANGFAGSGNTAQATGYRAATNFTADAVPVMQVVKGANGTSTHKPEGKLVLDYLKTLYIKTSAASTTNCSITFWAYFKELD